MLPRSNLGATPPPRALTSAMRLPWAQRPGAAATRQLLGSLQIPDALRRVKTTSHLNRKATGLLPSPQNFIRSPNGGVNTSGSMIAGASLVNASRSVTKTRGQTIPQGLPGS